MSDDRRYVTVELRHEAWIWDVAARRIVWSKKAPDWQDLPPVSLHRDQLFTRNIETNVVEVWDLRQGKQFASLALPAVATPAAVIGYSNDWSYFATKTSARQVQIWERASQRILASLPLAADALKVSFSANGQFCILEQNPN